MQGRKTPLRVHVLTTARLHMGFLDMHGGLGRRYGSLGLSLDRPATRLWAARSGDLVVRGEGSGRARRYAEQFFTHAGLDGGAILTLEEVIPEHAGLGSGTQMALAVGVALARLYDLSLSVRDIAAWTERGARSGIGIGAFERGGLLLDGGRANETLVPPVISRMDFPAAWRILLLFDNAGTGVFGDEEIEAFRTLPVFPEATAAALCRRVLMQALPAVAELNLAAFGEAIHEVQCQIGDHFAAAQGGRRYTSLDVSDALEWLRTQGSGCVGQSSWGPTGFAVVENESEARRLLVALQARYADRPNMKFVTCKARNEGSEVRVVYENDLVDRACAVN